jgi:flagellar protein FlgJ
MSLVVAAAVGAAVAAVTGKPKKLKNIGKAKKLWLDSFTASAKIVCEKNKIPFQVCVTQAALESGWGAKAPGFNYFGIKGSGDAGTQYFTATEVVKGVKVKMKMGFAKFSSIDAGIQGYCNVMNNNQRFKPAVENFSDDPVGFFIWIWSAGYATHPDYVNTCLGVMSVIYRATGDESFNVKISKARLKILGALKSKKNSSQRMEYASSALGMSKTLAAIQDLSEIPVVSVA